MPERYVTRSTGIIHSYERRSKDFHWNPGNPKKDFSLWIFFRFQKRAHLHSWRGLLRYKQVHLRSYKISGSRVVTHVLSMHWKSKSYRFFHGFENASSEQKRKSALQDHDYFGKGPCCVTVSDILLGCFFFNALFNFFTELLFSILLVEFMP